MILFFLIAIAAFFNAVMDKTETIISFNSSVFKNLDGEFWCKVNSASRPFILGTEYRADAWHLSKSLMIIFMALAIVFYTPVFNWLIDFILVGASWNLVFNLCYNKLLIPWKKKH